MNFDLNQGLQSSRCSGLFGDLLDELWILDSTGQAVIVGEAVTLNWASSKTSSKMGILNLLVFAMEGLADIV